jgi:hypothetical protein
VSNLDRFMGLVLGVLAPGLTVTAAARNATGPWPCCCGCC